MENCHVPSPRRQSVVPRRGFHLAGLSRWESRDVRLDNEEIETPNANRGLSNLAEERLDEDRIALEKSSVALDLRLNDRRIGVLDGCCRVRASTSRPPWGPLVRTNSSFNQGPNSSVMKVGPFI